SQRERNALLLAIPPCDSQDFCLDIKPANQQNGKMKTTLDLPAALVKQVKLRALHEGRKLKDAMADLLRKGLAAARDNRAEPMLTKDKDTGLPLIECKHPAAPHDEVTPERVAEILLTQDAGWHHDASR